MKKYMVGGAVRDKLMGLEPKDVDYVVVGSTPEEMLAAGFQQVGADFPVFLDPNGVEYALARTERKSGHGYNGFVTDHSAAVTLEDDLLRRDLTINAMAMDGDVLIDPFNGFKHLDNKILRHVSEAFADDPVRVLRLARFHARFGPEWVIDADTAFFARKMVVRGELKHLTRERVLKEFEKALGEPHPRLFFSTLRLCGALDEVLPEIIQSSRDLDDAFLSHFGGSAKFNYAKLTESMEYVDSFETRLNVSIEWKKYAKMYRMAMSKSNLWKHPVSVLYQMDVFRQSAIWEELIKEFDATGMLPYIFNLVEAYEKTKHVNFASLTEEQQKTLKGPDIALAIKERRMDLI